MKKTRDLNNKLLFSSFAVLIVAGFISLYSASTVESFKNSGTTTFYIFRQLLYGLGFGLPIMFVSWKLGLQRWKNLALPLVIVSLLLLILVHTPLGVSAGGATRWLKFTVPGINFLLIFQPSEIAKLALIVYLSAWIAKRRQEIKKGLRAFIAPLFILCLFAGLILSQPDLGTMIIIAFITLSLFVASGLSFLPLISMLTLGFVFLAFYIKIEPYRVHRILTFFNPTLDPLGKSYQINQAIMAIGAGGLWGYGYGLSRQKHFYLPESLTDSVFAVIAEELGFLRILIIILLFSVVLIAGLRFSKNCPDDFGKFLSFGIITWLVFQAAMNIASITGLLPLTGIPLPFFSYGSTSLVTNFMALGLLLAVANLNTTRRN